MWETGKHVPLTEVAMQLWKIAIMWEAIGLRVLNMLTFQENPDILYLFRSFPIS